MVLFLNTTTYCKIILLKVDWNRQAYCQLGLGHSPNNHSGYEYMARCGISIWLENIMMADIIHWDIAIIKFTFT